MRKIEELLTARMQQAFADAGYDSAFGQVQYTEPPKKGNKPKFCDYQCNGAFAAANKAGVKPFQVAGEVAKHFDCSEFGTVNVVGGFINITLSGEYLHNYLEQMRTAPQFGLARSGEGRTVVVDYGGPNVAKPLHIGHLRSAIIGESIKRLYHFFGYHTIGDIHLGDWGLQMGLIITELQDRQPDLCYFDPDYTGEYPVEPPFTLAELEEIYPAASRKKSAEADLSEKPFTTKAHTATFELQQGRRGYIALWKHIMNLSLADMRRIYQALDVHFESWLGESDADPYIPAMVADFKARGIAEESEGAWVVHVAEEEDKEEIKPCILVKSDGSSIYATTDLATMVQRMQDWNPWKMFYVTDKRQNNHFLQVFRAAKKGGIVPADYPLEHLGFGTMNGPDGKPFKTRDGGVMRLEQLISDMTEFVRAKVVENNIVAESDVEQTTAKIAMAALKYGDLRNQPTNDYKFELDKFAAFEGNTGPYILYSIVRIKSILAKYGEYAHLPIQAPTNPHGQKLMLTITRFAPMLESALNTASPNLICDFIFDLASALNKFYQETPILKEADETVKAGHIALIGLTKDMLETCIGLLGFSAPDKM